MFYAFFSSIFGPFENNELTKFLKLGLVFGLILGTYWTLGTIKESLLSNMIGPAMLPLAKIFSLALLIPILALYSKLSDIVSRNRLFIIISVAYALITVVYSLLVALLIASESCLVSTTPHWTLYVVCFSFYAFVESYGALLVALFWAIATDTTHPSSAAKGFPLIVMCGQVGGILGPLLLCKIPRYCRFTTSSIAITISSLLMLFSCIGIYYFFKTTPPSLLQSYKDHTIDTAVKNRSGFFEGLYIIVRSWYLICIFGILFFFEFITQTFDFHFKYLARQQLSGLPLAEYIGFYGSMINFCTLLCLVLGINKITRRYGITIALLIVPIIVGIALFIIKFDNITIIFWLLISLRALNFSLTIPATKQLYIPTSPAIRYKAQAWIDSIGSRIARQSSSIYFMLIPTITAVSHYSGLCIVALWISMALYSGATYKKVLKEDSHKYF